MDGPRPFLPEVIHDLNQTGYPFALVGAFAVAVHAAERFTKDIDFAVVVQDETAALKLLERLKKGYTIVDPQRDLETNELQTVVITPKGDRQNTVRVDLLLNTCGVEREVVDASQPVEVFPGVRVDVATRGHLIAMKTLSLDDANRPQDRVDLAGLLKEASESDMEQAREALDLMQERGFGFIAGKDDLQAELDQHCQLYAPHLELAHDYDMEM